MERRHCKCGNEMTVIKEEFAWYWCSNCGRFLNGSQLLDPGDAWLEPLSSGTVVPNVAMQNMRFEVIDENGRIYVRYGVYLDLRMQDDNRTLKVFVSES